MSDQIEVTLKIDGIPELKQAVNDAAQAARTLNSATGNAFGGFGGRSPGSSKSGGPGSPPPLFPNGARQQGWGGWGPGGPPPPFTPRFFGNFAGNRFRVLPPPPPLFPANPNIQGPIRGPSQWQQMVSFGRQVFFVSRAARLAEEAFRAMVKPLEEAAKATRIWNAAALSGGGASGFTMGNALGMGPGGAASAANAFRQRLSSDPLAVMGFGRAMVPAAFGGDQDNSKLLREAIERLAHVTDENSRILKARQMGLEAFLPMTYAPTQTRMLSYAVDNVRNADAKRQRGINADTDMNWAMGKEAAQSEHHLWDTGMNWASRAFRWGEVGSAQARAAAQFDHAGFKHWDDVRSGRYDKSLHKDQSQELMDNTEALKMLAGLLKGGRGTFGGGARAHAAIPPGLTGLRLQQAIQEDTLRLGGVVR